ncbi:MAG: 4-(cytidine 5'-diphospho)-2-C-methyl-D-erythritol kinase [Spirochaetes bacterium]|nr:4-(cytidine 5'-diphospho)-2-C-methyl-D-erythritol kinase [Spirochaetota bacterium]
MTYSTTAYAKVNLHLEVLNKRSDFYHNIFSFNASLDLFDRLTFKRLIAFNRKSGDMSIDIQPEGGEYPDIILSVRNEDNLITKAIQAYLERIGKSASVTVAVEKNIPAGAGLGGGSSDAAATLRLINSYFSENNEGIPETELRQIGAEIGADVPYCLSGGFAVCEGIGEIIENFEGKLNYWIIVINSGIIVNTAKAYSALGRTASPAFTEKEIIYKKELFREGLSFGELGRFKQILKNDFEESVFNMYPELKKIKGNLTEFLPDYATMTGSGSSIIGLFKEREKAEAAAKKLKKFGKIFISRFK